MKTETGLWIDSRDAFVVAITGNTKVIHRIHSGIERHPARAEAAEEQGAYESQRVKADDIRQKAMTQQLDHYYDEVIALVQKADSLLIFGPGEARTQLKKRLDEKKADTRVVGVEAADSMTEHQIIAKIEKHFTL